MISFSSALARGIFGLAVSCMAFSLSPAQHPIEILFVGNSFTHGHVAPAQTYNSGLITDANGTGYGGVPGIFKQFTLEEGLNYSVTIEAVGGEDLQGHFQTKSAIIGQPDWDVVVLQEQSTQPLPASHGGDPGLYYTGAENLQNLILANNPAAQIYLYETWASPTSVANQGYTNAGGLQAMQDDLQDATYTVYYGLGLSGVARAGDAFMRAVDQGVADANPANGISPGMVNLWAADSRHASAYGSYLAAAVLYAEITGADPRSLSVGVGSAAAGLGLDATAADSLNRIAYEITALPDPDPVPQPAKNPLSGASFSGSASAGTPENITGNAAISSLTTDEGAFSDLTGATANNVVTSNALSSVGTMPISANAAVSGLSANDGVNNLQSGNFQFSAPLDETTRFFILESAPQSSAVGDAATITLIDAFNMPVGTYSLSLSVSDFTSSPANNTANALATLTYTSGQGTLTAKLGGVSFALADFSGTGDLSLVTGIRIVSTTLDPNVVGMYSVPEPGTALLALSGIGALLFSRRRACRAQKSVGNQGLTAAAALRRKAEKLRVDGFFLPL